MNNSPNTAATNPLDYRELPKDFPDQSPRYGIFHVPSGRMLRLGVSHFYSPEQCWGYIRTVLTLPVDWEAPDFWEKYQDEMSLFRLIRELYKERNGIRAKSEVSA